MRMRSQKIRILMLRKYESSGERTAYFFHRDILGAHRYTTRGGMCVLRRPLHGAGCLSSIAIRGNDLPPSLRYPFIYFAFDEGLKISPSSSTKSASEASVVRSILRRSRVSGYG